MPVLQVFTSLPFLLGLLATCKWVTYKAFLPKPLPGIPFNEAASKKLFGDVPEMIRYVLRTNRIFCWLTSLTTRHSSPIVQAFIKPGSLPWIILTDPHESQDILLRRTKEFDRSGFFGELIGGILPEQHIQFLSTDARFKKNRGLINHLMAPDFVKRISAPEVWNSFELLVEMWKRKCDVAKGRPFDAKEDIRYAALDAIFASSFGLPEEQSITVRRLNAVLSSPSNLLVDANGTVPFDQGVIPEIFKAVLTLADSVTWTQLSPFPVLTSWILRKLPFMRRATAIKDSYIRYKTDECVRLIETGQHEPKSALHSVLLREREIAVKEQRQPEYYKRAIADEFFGFMLAGHDTEATAMSWGVKYMTDNPESQTKLREALHQAFPDALSAKRAPTYAELARTTVPYLDAVVEEILRHANTIAFVVRRAQCDTTVLGHHVPKGTDVFLMANGPGYLEPNMPLPHSYTHASDITSTSTHRLTPLWPDAGISDFSPERWLRPDGSFDSMAGPTLAFGLGPRGCFGKRLAVQALRMGFARLVWEFVFLGVGEEQGGYESVQKFAREPVKCFIRVEKVM
ncbi:cytochrome P450 [Paraphoma chrysanthemicola]|uniref:Cytochrome P450 n=1 Tax=Paraphoma chrysanthemicola TaxID=798071 RepID=A0A8K0RBK0_9PLEO|nr:cytochrome P450 [Paraphoma chrysanthemicola]